MFKVDELTKEFDVFIFYTKKIQRRLVFVVIVAIQPPSIRIILTVIVIKEKKT